MQAIKRNALLRPPTYLYQPYYQIFAWLGYFGWSVSLISIGMAEITAGPRLISFSTGFGEYAWMISLSSKALLSLSQSDGSFVFGNLV